MENKKGYHRITTYQTFVLEQKTLRKLILKTPKYAVDLGKEQLTTM